MRRPGMTARHGMMRRLALAVGVVLVLVLAIFSHGQPAALTLSGFGDRLRAAGANVVTGGETQQPFFSPTGRFLNVYGDDV